MILVSNALLASSGSYAGGSSNLWYFLIAYLLLWALIFGYLFYLHGRMKKLEKEFENQNMDPFSTNDDQEESGEVRGLGGVSDETE